MRPLADHGHVKRVGCRWDDRQVMHVGAGHDKYPCVTTIQAAKQPYIVRDGVHGFGRLGMDGDFVHTAAVECGGVPHADAQRQRKGIGQHPRLAAGVGDGQGVSTQ